MDAQHAGRWGRYQLIAHLDEREDKRPQQHDTVQRTGATSQSPTVPTAMELLIFVPEAKVYMLKCSDESDDALEWRQLEAGGGFTIARAIGASTKQPLFAAILGVDTSSFLWSVEIDTQVSPESHGQTFHFRSVDGLVLAVWCPNSASTDRIKFCVMSAFLDGSSRCTQAGDDLGMGQLLEALRRTKSTAAAASHPSFTLGRGLGRLRLPAQGAPIDGDTQSRQEESPPLSFEKSNSSCSPTSGGRSTDHRVDEISNNIQSTHRTDEEIESHGTSSFETGDDYTTETLRSALQAALNSDEFVEGIIDQLRLAIQSTDSSSSSG